MIGPFDIPPAVEREIRRHVEWYYRATLQAPPDPVDVIARDAGVPVETVVAGIAEARGLLNRFTALFRQGQVQVVNGPGRKPWFLFGSRS